MRIIRQSLNQDFPARCFRLEARLGASAALGGAIGPRTKETMLSDWIQKLHWSRYEYLTIICDLFALEHP